MHHPCAHTPTYTQSTDSSAILSLVCGILASSPKPQIWSWVRGRGRGLAGSSQEKGDTISCQGTDPVGTEQGHRRELAADVHQRCLMALITVPSTCSLCTVKQLFLSKSELSTVIYLEECADYAFSRDLGLIGSYCLKDKGAEKNSVSGWGL